jgi:predicted helicase
MLGKDAQDWKVALAQKDLLDSGPTREKIVPVLYRPFDVRHTYYTGHSQGFICRPRPEVMRHMLAGENVALITPKQHKDEFGALTTDAIGAHKSVAAYDINYYFPLYLYPSAHRGDLFAHHEPSERRPNVNPALVQVLAEAYGRVPTPEEIFHYVYAVLYAPAYRVK